MSGRCATCGFDEARWTLRDLVTSAGAIGGLWHEVVGELPPAVRSRAPDRQQPTIDERGAALAAALVATDGDVVRAIGTTANAGDPVARAASSGELDALLSDRAADLRRRISRLDRAGWATPIVGRGPEATVRSALLELLHRTTHTMHEVGRDMVRLGVGSPPQQGIVAQINVSDGGVPKRPITSARVDAGGVVGDRQKTRDHHGRPFQALCLWSVEVIEGLAAAGHPIAPGSAGENLTISGLDWNRLRPGALVRLGEVDAEITSYATPCKQNARWFSDRDFRRIDHERNPGTGRLYAAVLGGGAVAVGDPVVVEPA